MICNVCNIRRAKTGSKGSETSPHNDMCNYCWEEGGQENTHSDAGHDGIAAQVAAGNGADLTKAQLEELEYMENSCWICRPELNLAKQAKGASTGTKKQSDRRPQLNHKGHSHPATPAARRACKAAFWAAVAAAKNQYSNDELGLAMSQWDSKLDGHGKPIPTKASTWTVVPSGPKGGVINQLKKGKPESFFKRLGKVERELAEAAGLVKAKGNPAK